MINIAVIKTGGKQYIVKEGTILKVEKLPGEVGGAVVFDNVLLMGEEPAQISAEQKLQSGKGGEVKIGAPAVEGAKVEGTIIEQGRGKKITVIKFKRKVRYKRKKGHRQQFTKIKIDKLKA